MAKRNIPRGKVSRCFRCHGTGSVMVISIRGLHESIDCNQCNGTGIVTTSDSCPSCDGVGSVFHGNSELQCPDCRGTGRQR